MREPLQPPAPLPDRALALVRAAALVGGYAALAQQLEVSERQLDRWLNKDARLPDAVFLRAIDIIIRNAGRVAGGVQHP